VTTMTRFFRPSEEGGGRGGKIRVEGGKDFLAWHALKGEVLTTVSTTSHAS